LPIYLPKFSSILVYFSPIYPYLLLYFVTLTVYTGIISSEIVDSNLKGTSEELLISFGTDKGLPGSYTKEGVLVAIELFVKNIGEKASKPVRVVARLPLIKNIKLRTDSEGKDIVSI